MTSEQDQERRRSEIGSVFACDQVPRARFRSMIAWDVMNGLARRSWARNEAAVSTIARAAKTDDMLEVTSPRLVDAGVLDRIFEHPR